MAIEQKTIEHFKPAADNVTQPEVSTEQQETHTWLDTRIKQLMGSRKNILGKDVDALWDHIDSGYVPGKLGRDKEKKVLVSDDEQGWRSRSVKLGSDNWQSDISAPDLFVKIQTALSILVERNPGIVLTPGAKKFENNTMVAKDLYDTSWQKAKSRKKMLVPVMFDSLKYGFALWRTYPKRIDGQYEVYRERINPKRAWLDDLATADDLDSARDWCWQLDFGYDTFREKFPVEDYPQAKFVKGSIIAPPEGESAQASIQYQDDNMVRCIFYENKEKNLLAVKANERWIGVMTMPAFEDESQDMEPQLTCSWAYCYLRDPSTPYGIGIIEAMKEDKALYDKLLNMTMDQLVLAIYKMFFHTGTDQNDASGEIRIKPGVGQQLSNPKDIVWNEVPGPGAEAWKGIAFAADRMNLDSGITETLQAEVTGKTLGEIFQAKDAALKRLKTPLDNIVAALEHDALYTIYLNSLIYSIPEVITLEDQDKIDEYLKEVHADPQLYQYAEDGTFQAKVYREVYLNLEKDAAGNFVETEESRFLRPKPGILKWRGMVTVLGQSMLGHTKELEKQMKLEMANLILPLIEKFVQGMTFLEKPIRQILKIYDERWGDWLPDSQGGSSQDQLAGVTPTGPEMPPALPPGAPPQATGAPGAAPATGNTPATVVPPSETRGGQRRATGIVRGVMNRLLGTPSQ